MINPCNTCNRECPDGGCKTWKDWWVWYWDTYISRAPKPKPKNRNAWQYEHPDLVREGNNG